MKIFSGSVVVSLCALTFLHFSGNKAHAQVVLGTQCSGGGRDYWSYAPTTSTPVSNVLVGTPSIMAAFQTCPQDLGAGYGCNSCINPANGRRHTLGPIGGGSTQVAEAVTWTWSADFQIGWNAPAGVVGGGGGGGARSSSTTITATRNWDSVTLTCPERKQLVRKTQRITTNWTQFIDQATCNWLGDPPTWVRRYNGPNTPGAQTATEAVDHTAYIWSGVLTCKRQKPVMH